MKFTNMVAVVAILAFAATANAYSDGTTTSTKEVNININTTSAQAQQAAPVAQPTTVVEAAPATESKAEALRKARQEAEMNTEEKIVEKLEDSRLQEEKARADRLFGNKLDPAPAPIPVAPAAQPVVAQPAPAPAPAPVQEQKPAQLTIENVVIEPSQQPQQQSQAQPVETKEIKDDKIQPVAESKIGVKEEKPEESKTKYYVGALAGNIMYSANNVKGNYGLGVNVGTMLDNHWGVELEYMYSNSDVGDLWYGDLFHKLDQNDLSLKAKYYFLDGKLRPFVGASMTYINRKYSEMATDPYYGTQNLGTEATTQAMDAGLLLGVDFAVTKSISIGGQFEYNFNVMNFNTMNYSNYYGSGYGYNNSNYQQVSGVTPLEQIAFYTLTVNAKFTF